LADPLLDLRLFREPAFSASLAAYGLGVFAVFGGFLFLPQYLQLVLGLSPLEAGLWTLPWALAFVAGSQLTPRIVRYVRPAYLMAGGLLLAAAGFGVFTQVDSNTGFGVIVTASTLFSLGTAPLFTLTNDLIIGSAPPERAGAAAGLSETAAEFGGAVGIAAFGSIGVAVYRSGMVDGVPSGVSAEAAQVARDTLGGAIDVAGRLSAEAGSALVDAARDAFTQGFHLAAGISAVASIGLAVLIAVVLRHVEAGTDFHADPDDEPLADVPEPAAVD
jgi:DHA2 family multidrug resistance protein-like MFS transporter